MEPTALVHPSILLGAHLIVADDEIGHDELRFVKGKLLEADNAQTEAGFAAILSDRDDAPSISACLSAVSPSASRSVVRFLALVANIEGDPTTSRMGFLTRVAEEWKIPEAESLAIIKEMATEADKYRTPRSALPNAPDPKRRGPFQRVKEFFLPRRIPETHAQAENRMLLATEDYANAVRRCAAVAEADAQMAAPALENCIAALEHVRATAQSQMAAANASGYETGREDVVDTLTSLDQALAEELEPQIRKISRTLEEQRRNLRDFTIAVVGRTKAGKSTLHAVLTGEGWDEIGRGALRTTRFNRAYRWDLLRLVDTPGIGAANASKDRQIAEIAINQSDVVVFVVMDDSIQTVELDFLDAVRASWKPVIVLLNVKQDLSDEESRRRFVRRPERTFRPDALAEHETRIRRRMAELLGNDFFDVIPVHLVAAKLAREAENDTQANELLQTSRLYAFLDHLRAGVLRDGELRRSQALLSATARALEPICLRLRDQRDSIEGMGLRLDSLASEAITKFQRAKDDVLAITRGQIQDVWDDVEAQIHPFAEEHWNENQSSLARSWKDLLDDLRIEERLKQCVNSGNDEFQERVERIWTDALEELRLTLDISVDIEHAEGAGIDFGHFIRRWGLRLAKVAAGLGLGMLIGGPPGAIAGALITLLFSLFDRLFKSEGQLRREAVSRIEESCQSAVRKWREDSLQDLEQMFEAGLSQMSNTIRSQVDQMASFGQHAAKSLHRAEEQVQEHIKALDESFAARVLTWLEQSDLAAPNAAPPAVRARVQSVDRSRGSMRIHVQGPVPRRLTPEEASRVLQIELEIIPGGMRAA